MSLKYAQLVPPLSISILDEAFESTLNPNPLVEVRVLFVESAASLLKNEELLIPSSLSESAALPVVLNFPANAVVIDAA
jgi:hypothetical protein